MEISTKTKLNKILPNAVVLLIIILIFGLIFCFVPRPNLYGAAQTINGNVITEDSVTDYIQNMRSVNNLEDDEAWAEYLSNNNQTPSVVRFNTIQTLENNLLLELVAKELGVEVTDTEVEESVNNDVSSKGGQEEFETYLSENGSSLVEYNTEMRYSLLKEKIIDSFYGDVADEVSDVAVLTEVNQKYKPWDTTYHYYLITWSANNEDFQNMANSVVNGDMSFEEFAEDLGMSLESIDKGWSNPSSIDSDIARMLYYTEKGNPSAIIENYSGVDGVNAMIMYDDLYTVPEGLNEREDINDDFFEYMKKTLTSDKEQVMFESYMTNYYDSANIILYSMPSGLPYDVSID